MSNDRVFIYGLRANGCSDYFYVGSTKRTVTVRLRQHLDSAKHKRTVNKHLEAKILKIGLANVVCDVLEETSTENRSGCEYSWIAKLREHGQKLANIQLSDIEARNRCRQESEWEKYLESIFTPDYVLWQLDKLEEPVVAQNPRYQSLAVGLHDLAVRYFQALTGKHKTEWFQKLGIDPECELSGVIQTRIKALPLLS
jgi:hypothetical protein